MKPNIIQFKSQGIFLDCYWVKKEEFDERSNRSEFHINNKLKVIVDIQKKIESDTKKRTNSHQLLHHWRIDVIPLKSKERRKKSIRQSEKKRKFMMPTAMVEMQ